MPAKHETWMPLYIADYLGDTMHLTAEQHGAYLLLLMAAWKRGGHVPDDDAQLAVITRTGDRWQTHVSAIVRAFFSQRDGLLVHGRVEAELLSARDKVSKRAEAGRAGAAAKWLKDGKRIGEPLANGKQSDAPSPSPITSPSGEVKAQRKRSATASVEKPEGVTDQTWADWLALRKDKKAPVTETVVKAAKREAAEAGITLDAFLAIWCLRGSQGLQASWLKPHELQQARQQPAQTFRERDAEAGMRKWEELTGQRHPDRDRAGGQVIEAQATTINLLEESR